MLAVEEFDEDFDKMFLGKDDGEAEVKHKSNPHRRTFVISATLGKAFFTSRMMTKKVKSDLKKIMKENPETVPNMKLKEIMKHITFKQKTKVIDMTQDVLLPETLEVLKVDCMKDEKMLYLYYFVNLYKDKTMIIFTNSISSASRIKSLLSLASKPIR
jgi:ATP-dependent RNA helicase DDX24/MAK5